MTRAPWTVLSGAVVLSTIAIAQHGPECHGGTLSNGTFGTPLAGAYFRRQWGGRSVAALYEKSRSTMPPALPGSLPAPTYADILAYVLEVNGAVVGEVALPSDTNSLAVMRIPDE